MIAHHHSQFVSYLGVTTLLPLHLEAGGGKSTNISSGTKILGDVPEQNAFYFYKRLHCYLGVKAKNLPEFLAELKTINVDSITFHHSRGDFGEWFKSTLGDAKLAGLVQALSHDDKETKSVSGEDLRIKLASIVQMRLASLQSSIAV